MSELSPVLFRENIEKLIRESQYISRDLSWLQFNYRVLDQVRSRHRTVFEKLKFLAITASNLDEFFMIRVGSLYNYLDYQKTRIDYSGLREKEFRIKLFESVDDFVRQQNDCLFKEVVPFFGKSGFSISFFNEITEEEQLKAQDYFEKTIFPMLTPMVYDSFHTFPMLMNKLLIFSVVTKDDSELVKEGKKLSFIQIPQNLPRFFELVRKEEVVFVPIESIIRANLQRLFRNVVLLSADLIRITRNGDFTLEESEDLENDFIQEIRQKLRTRRTGRVVRLEVLPKYSKWMLRQLSARWKIDSYNVFDECQMLDLTALWQIVKHPAFKYDMPLPRNPVKPLALKKLPNTSADNIFKTLRKKDVLLHHPFNTADYLLELLENAAGDKNVLAIKMTIYRLAEDSRVTAALLRAAEKGKHVSVLFELKARFDEENNIKEALKLEKAGCFVIHGIGTLKTHTKMLLIVRKEGDKVRRYVHMGTGNYNESTAKLYTDIGLMSTKEAYGNDVSEFFNAITGHSFPTEYSTLLTAPDFMRNSLIALIEKEAHNATQGLRSGIVFKMNSLQDDKIIDSLYRASNAGVKIKLIVRGICCLRPNRKGLSENIEVRSLVGNYLEHSRLFYFRNNDEPIIYCGSADAMVRSFDRRIESLFLIIDEDAKQEAINILDYNLKDNVNAYKMKEDGSYEKIGSKEDEAFNSHETFFEVTPEIVKKASLFGETS